MNLLIITFIFFSKQDTCKKMELLCFSLMQQQLIELIVNVFSFENLLRCHKRFAIAIYFEIVTQFFTKLFRCAFIAVFVPI